LEMLPAHQGEASGMPVVGRGNRTAGK
jgi:hypothetical protein